MSLCHLPLHVSSPCSYPTTASYAGGATLSLLSLGSRERNTRPRSLSLDPLPQPAMPAWWAKKLSLTRKPDDPAAAAGGSRKAKEKARSFDEVLARRGKAAAAACAGSPSSSSGFDSDGAAEKRGHPLPRPSALSGVALAHLDPASASASVSSASSSGSSDETPDLGFACSYR